MTGTMHVLDQTGDTKVIWDAENADEVDTARRTFKDLTKKGYRGFRVDKRGEQGTLMADFDPSAEKMIMAPPVRGG